MSCVGERATDVPVDVRAHRGRRFVQCVKTRAARTSRAELTASRKRNAFSKSRTLSGELGIQRVCDLYRSGVVRHKVKNASVRSACERMGCAAAVVTTDEASCL